MIRRSLVLLVVLSSGAALAQSAGAQAEVLFRQGRELLAAGKIPEACSAFDESQRLDPAISTLLNLASCREQAGQYATAWGLFLDAERQTRSASDDAGRKFHDIAMDHSKKLEARVSKLTINVSDKSKFDQLEILRDKEPVAAVMWNRAFPLDGGTYTITARAPGANTWTTQVTIAREADTKTVEIPDLRTLPRDLGVPNDAKPVTAPTPVPVTPPPPEMPSPTSPSKVVPIVLGGSAVVLLGGSLGFALWGNSTYDKAKAEMADQARRDSLESSANTKRYVAEGLAVAGVGCAGVAIWMYVRGRNAESTATSTARRLVISPTGFAVAGEF